MTRALMILVILLAAAPAAAGPWQGFTSLALAPDGLSFATGGREGEVLWWDTKTGELLARWSLPEGKPVVGLAFDSQGRLGVASLDGHLAVASVEGGLTALMDPPWGGLETAPARWAGPGPVVRTGTDELWAAGGADGRITVGGLGLNPVTWAAHSAAVTGLVLADGLLISVSYDGTLGLWDPRTGESLGRL